MSEPDDGPWDGATEHDNPDLAGDDPPTVRATLAQRVSVRAAARAPVASTLPPPGETRAPARPPTVDDQVILLDTVSSSAPTGESPRRGESASGGLVIVATGAEAERARKLCHANGLLVPVMASIAIVHEALSVVVIGEPSPPAPERVVHVVRASISDAQLLSLLRALVSGHVVVEPAAATAGDEPRVTEAARRLSTLDDRGAIEMIAIEAITAVTEADRAHCLYHDPFTGALWSESTKRTLGDSRRAMGGLVGWAAHTGEAIHASPAGDDPRWLAELDDPDGKAQSRVLVQPVIGADRRVHAVFVAARRWRRPAFSDQDRARLAHLATLAAPAIDLAVAAAASGPAERKPKATQPGPLAKEAAKHAAVLDSRHERPSTPPLTAARAGSESKPPPTTRTPGGSRDPHVATPVAGSATTVKSEPAPIESVVPRDGRTATPVAGTPSANERANEPAPPSKNDAGARSKSDSTAGKPVAKPADGDPHEVAVVATDEEAIARVKRIAKKSRLELAVVSRAEDVPPYYRIVTLGEAWSPDADPRVVYVARQALADDQLADLLAGLASDRSVVPAPALSAAHGAAEARRAQLAFAGARKLATASDLAEAEATAVSTMRELLDADRAYCLFFDPADGSLWSEARERRGGDDRRAIAGITGWVARTGKPAAVDRASADPRWLQPLDDPDGDPHGQLLVQPIVRADRRVRGVLVAVRRAKRPGFGELDASLLARFAALVAPLLEQLEAQIEAQRLLGEEDDAPAAPPPAAGSSPRDVLARAPRWTFAVAGAVLMWLVVLAARC